MMLMKNFFLIIIFATIVSCGVKTNSISERDNYQGYSLDAYNSCNKIYFEKDTIFSDENYGDKSVLVIVENKRMFANDIDSILDTLKIKYKYHLITETGSIRRYSNLKTIQKVLIVE